MFESIFTSDWLLTFDMNIYKFSEKLWLDGSAGSIMDGFWTFISHLGDDGTFFIILSVVLCLFKKTRKLGISTLFAIGFSSLFNTVILKDFFERARPYVMDNSNWQRISTDGWVYTMPFESLKEKSFSFPSGHTATAFAFSTGAFFADKKKSIPLYILAFLIGFSRIYIHVHFPSDVIGGMILGILFSIISSLILFKILNKPLEKLNAKCNFKLFPVDGDK